MKNEQNVRQAFQSILRADYISINDINQLKKLEEYYVDIFKNLPIVLQDQDNFINGRRGSGKTTLLMRAYYECLKTISPKISSESQYITSRKILPLYIDLSQCKDIFGESNEQVFERIFIERIVFELKNQLNIMFETNIIKRFKNNNFKNKEFEYIETILKNGIQLKVSKNDIKEEIKKISKDNIECSLSFKDPLIASDSEEKKEVTTTHNIDELRSVSIQSFLNSLGNIKKESKIDAIYIFLDEFSELSPNEQQRFSILLKKLLGSKNNIFFKIGTITGRYNFGENIIIGRDIFPISLDLNDFVERYGGIVSAIKTLEDFSLEIIESRLRAFKCNLTFSDVFQGQKGEIISRITRESMGIPRTIGIILQNALIQSEVNNKQKKYR